MKKTKTYIAISACCIGVISLLVSCSLYMQYRAKWDAEVKEYEEKIRVEEESIAKIEKQIEELRNSLKEDAEPVQTISPEEQEELDYREWVTTNLENVDNDSGFVEKKLEELLGDSSNLRNRDEIIVDFKDKYNKDESSSAVRNLVRELVLATHVTEGYSYYRADRYGFSYMMSTCIGVTDTSRDYFGILNIQAVAPGTKLTTYTVGLFYTVSGYGDTRTLTLGEAYFAENIDTWT